MPTTINAENTTTDLARCAGDFQSWLQDTVNAFSSGQGTCVPCGDCKACCRAGYFIPVHRQEWSTRAAIPARLLVTPPAHCDDGNLSRQRGHLPQSNQMLIYQMRQALEYLPYGWASWVVQRCQQLGFLMHVACAQLA